MALNKLITLFDSQWYYKQYPDVAAAGQDAWTHYKQFGHAEGRQPCEFTAFQLEHELWFNNTTSVIQELKALLSENTVDTQTTRTAIDRCLACWVLARWYAARQQTGFALQYLEQWLGDILNLQRPTVAANANERLLALSVIGHLGPLKLWFSLLIQNQELYERAHALLNHPLWAANSLQLPTNEKAETSDRYLGEAGLVHTRHLEKVTALNKLFETHGLMPLASQHGLGELFDDLGAAPRVSTWSPTRKFFRPPTLISVIVPSFNPGPHILTTLRALCEQTWKRIEIVLVDDASTDDSVTLVTEFIREYKPVANCVRKFKLIRLNTNQGAYAARNEGIRQAKGALLTVHDSDDWSHPQKLELQAQALVSNKEAMASLSHWVRCTNNLTFGRWRAEATWVYPNVSSLMIRRKVLKKIGYWDLVSVNADSEYIERLRSVFGMHAIKEVLPGVPLSFGRHDGSSLSQNSKTHLWTQFFGVRRDYMEQARAWHQAQKDKNQPLYIPAAATTRPFCVPPMICRGPAAMRQENLDCWVNVSGFFDKAYYLARYPDVDAAGVDPYLHYLKSGEAEGRDASPVFSATGYRAALAALGQPLAKTQSALHDAAEKGLSLASADAAARVVFNSLKEPCTDDKGWLAVCAHSAQGQAFGAENSLLDALQALQQEWNILLVLPHALAPEYIAKLTLYADSIIVFPYQWWNDKRQPSATTLSAFVRLFKQYEVQAVYINTITLDEPLRAAKAINLPVTVHVRELLQDDPGLRETLGFAKGADCESLFSFLHENADVLIANSSTVASWLAAELKQLAGNLALPKVEVVPNCIQVAPTCSTHSGPLPFVKGGGVARLQVGMFSSNLPKKGLYDFFELAKILIDCADFYLYGPLNTHVEAFLNTGNPPRNFHYCGYSNEIRQDMQSLDVVVNLSHFAESFGRSILEAMAAHRVVAAYRHGALPELIGDAGLLVDTGDVSAMSQTLRRLQQDPQRAIELSQQAAKRAEDYAFTPYAAKLRAALLQAQN